MRKQQTQVQRPAPIRLYSLTYTATTLYVQTPPQTAPIDPQHILFTPLSLPPAIILATTLARVRSMLSLEFHGIHKLTLVPAVAVTA